MDIIEAQSVGIEAPHSKDAYNRHRDRVAQNERNKSASGRDIGEIPPVKNQGRRDSCRLNLRLYLETYHAGSFPLEWSPDHLRVIAKIQTAVLIGGRQALAMPRGSGKTSICICAAIWSILYGHHTYVMLLQANKDKAKEIMMQVIWEFEATIEIIEDFPEICHPIAALERIAQRAKGQTYHGEPTHVVWSGDKLVFPVIPGSVASGSVLCVAGLQEAVRGALFFHPAKRTRVRPTLAIIDDPQTRISAKSEEECVTREKIIRADLIGMAGPGVAFSAIMPCTIIEPNDVADRLLDTERNPEWRGECCKMLYSFPDNMELWFEYDSIRRRTLKQADEKEPETAVALSTECNEFYRAHQKEMDAGAEAAWEQRKLPHEVSAIQHAMNLFLSDPDTFWSEYQNDPQAAIEHDLDLLEAGEIARKVNGFERYQIPAGCQYVTGFVDCHKRILYYGLIAWTPSFDGYVIERDVFPKQRHAYFTEKTARPTLQEVFPGCGVEGALYKGIEAVIRLLFSLPLRRIDGAHMPIDLLSVDGRYKTEVVRQVVAASEFQGRVVPQFGRMIGPDQKQLSLCKPRKGEHIGLEWTIPPVQGDGIREIQIDTNWWKTFTQQRLSTPIGDAGCLSLYGRVERGRVDVDHGMFGQHLASQYPAESTGKQRTIEVWDLKPGETQDHWLDVVVGATAAASVKGATILPTVAKAAKKRKPRRKLKSV